MSHLLSMSAFALAASISPGPVNIVALSTGAQHGLRASMRHVTGATIGFTLLLLLTGLGLHEIQSHWPYLTKSIQWAGVTFLFYMAYKLAVDDGRLGAEEATKGPSLLSGAAMQWLNPKAWLASLAGMGAYAANGDRMLVWQFTVVYFVICYGSIACWAYAGSFLRQYLSDPKRVRLFNRLMALLLAGSAVYLLQA
ncbi:lysine transporter LysE [Cupriavidus sp. USMAA2-4]|uniref:Lysine transporter LysE n=1 Tax=Cupriavidus malaysiensis TaxID=367825 RepID=A0ABM6FCW5_9BURK|nr:MULTISPECIES: LysE family translocator [Cupriavidus]AOY96585.1 lysine transporter LysE [Cupriavidus sp. USMAA2-4]AOZ03008.1 lysine transporter LysE [Cupriavidus sp. USMAHM13]AOZ09619.1 lysine transporter LysE [Cupriavidus malaysiensis]